MIANKTPKTSRSPIPAFKSIDPLTKDRRLLSEVGEFSDDGRHLAPGGHALNECASTAGGFEDARVLKFPHRAVRRELGNAVLGCQGSVAGYRAFRGTGSPGGKGEHMPEWAGIGRSPFGW